jgi:catechol 2,3-dioxygenase-like lactoylglutathione lyase family enzyme
MGASTRDIFGTAESAETASPGSYGQAPRGFRLPDGARLGRVHLQVADLSRSLMFYEQVLGLRQVYHDGAASMARAPSPALGPSPGADRWDSTTSPSCYPTAPRWAGSSGTWGTSACRPGPPITW